MDRQTLISELVGEAYPAAVAVDGRLRRNWIARTADVLPDEHALARLTVALDAEVIASITTAYSSAATPAALAHARPSITLIRLDEHHLVVRTEFAGPEESVGDAAVIAQWGVLQALDRQLRLDEVQGLPSDYWFALRAGREAR